MSKYLPVLIGPYSAHEAEQIADEFFDCKVASDCFEELLRASITWDEYCKSVLFLVETIYSYIKDKEHQLQLEADHDSYWEDV